MNNQQQPAEYRTHEVTPGSGIVVLGTLIHPTMNRVGRLPGEGQGRQIQTIPEEILPVIITDFSEIQLKNIFS